MAEVIFKTRTDSSFIKLTNLSLSLSLEKYQTFENRWCNKTLRCVRELQIPDGLFRNYDKYQRIYNLQLSIK